MKLCVTGKGGVGKTTVAGTLARLYARRGYSILAIDADPNYNLHASLGIPEEDISAIVPLAEMEALIRERTGAEPYGFGAVFKANPRVADLPERLALPGPDGLRFILMGTVRSAGTGCTCPANVLLKNFIRKVLADEDHVIVDMEAGIEHLGRGTARYADLALIVLEPSVTSIATAVRIGELASQLGLPHVALANKVRGPESEAYVKERLEGMELLGSIPLDECVNDAQMKGRALIDLHPESDAVAALEDVSGEIIGRASR